MITETKPAKSTTRLSDAELVLLLRSGSYAGYEYLYDNYSSTLYGIIYRIINNQNTAEDVLQEVFVKIWSNIGSYESEKGALFTWMVNISRNQAIDKIRSKNYKNEQKNCSADTYKAQVGKMHDTADLLENFDIINFVHRLVSHERFVIELAYFQGYSHSHIADEFNIPLGTVKSRIRNGIQNLRMILAEAA